MDAERAVEKAELYGVVGALFAVIAGLVGLAYSTVVGRIERHEAKHDADMKAVWDAVGEQRKDVKEILAKMLTKDDMDAAERRLVLAVRGGHAD